MFKFGCTHSDTIHLHVTPLAALLDHGSSPPPTLSLVYSLSLTSCFCLTLLSCVSHSCNIALLCSLLHFQYPRPNALFPILVYKTPAYVCIQHVQISTLILVFIVYSTHSVIPNSDSILLFWNKSSFHLNSRLNLFFRLHS